MGCGYSKVKPALSQHKCCILCTYKNMPKDSHPFSKFWIELAASEFKINGGTCPKMDFPR
jgi:hypothetical protein